MSLSKKSIKEFQKIYTKHSGKKLPYKTAREEAEKLLRLFEIVYASPLTKEEYDTIVKYDKSDCG